MTRKFKPLAILHWHGWGNDLAFPYSYDWRAKLAPNELGLFQVRGRGTGRGRGRVRVRVMVRGS